MRWWGWMLVYLGLVVLVLMFLAGATDGDDE